MDLPPPLHTLSSLLLAYLAHYNLSNSGETESRAGQPIADRGVCGPMREVASVTPFTGNARVARPVSIARVTLP